MKRWACTRRNSSITEEARGSRTVAEGTGRCESRSGLRKLTANAAGGDSGEEAEALLAFLADDEESNGKRKPTNRP